MKICSTCGARFDGDVAFCPHDGTSLQEERSGQVLHGLVALERLLYIDTLGARYEGTLQGGGQRVRVTVLSEHARLDTTRADAVRATQALLGDALPEAIATVHGWGLDMQPGFIIEELPKGPTLAEWTKDQGPLPWRQALGLGCGILRAAEWLDAQGVTHRALQPQAIVIRDLKRGHVTLTEWAHGVLTHRASPLAAARDGAYPGAAAYMAPEQVEDQRAADRRSTVYTVGALLVELMTGKPLVSGEDDEAILLAHQRAEHPKLSTLRSGLPAQLDDVFELILQKDPASRFQAPTAMINVLTTIMGEGASADDFPELAAPDAPRVRLEIPEALSHLATDSAASEVEDDAEDASSGRRQHTMLFGSAIPRDGGEVAANIARAKQAASEAATPAEDSSPEYDEADAAEKPTIQMTAEQVRAERDAERDTPNDDGAVRVVDPEDDDTPSTRERRRKKKRTAPAPAVEATAAPEAAKAEATPAPAETPKAEPTPEAATPVDAPAPKVEPTPPPAAAATATASDDDDDADDDTDDEKDSPARKKRRKKRRPEGRTAMPTARLDEKTARTVRADTEASKGKGISGSSATNDAAAATSTPVADPEATPASAEAPKAASSKAISGGSSTRDAATSDAPAETGSGKERDRKRKTAPEDAAKSKPAAEAPAQAATAAASSAKKTPEELDDWFATPTEDAWEQTALREHRERTERKWNQRMFLIVGAILSIIIIVSLYLGFVYQPPKEEQSALPLDHTPTRMLT